MCISALVETDLEKLAALLGVPRLLASTPKPPCRRVEAHQSAWIIRQSGAGRLVAEAMSFNPYVVRRSNIGGDMWASSLLANNHGLVVLRGYSDWVSAQTMIEGGMIHHHEANCAFNRSQSQYGPQHGGDSRQLLVNFTPRAPLLVPVLFDQARPQVLGQELRKEFVMISDQTPPLFDQLGLSQAPLALDLHTALEWLFAADLDPEIDDCSAFLDDSDAPDCALALYKSA